MSNKILHAAAGYGDPAWNASAVTPADEDLATKPTIGLYVGTTGDLSVVMAGGATVTLVGVPAGTFCPLRVDQVRSTATTADDIVAFYGP